MGIGAEHAARESRAYGRRLYGGSEDANRQVVERVGAVAAARGVPRAQIALAWLLHKPVVTAPIVGVSRLAHLDDAVASLGVRLSEEEMRALEERYVPHTASFVS